MSASVWESGCIEAEIDFVSGAQLLSVWCILQRAAPAISELDIYHVVMKKKDCCLSVFYIVGLFGSFLVISRSLFSSFRLQR
jgi:hypothetical protein